MVPAASPRFGPAGRAERSSTTPGVVVVPDENGVPAAVLDHAPSPARVYCRDCAYTTEFDDEAREDLDESQVGDVLICDSCGRDISELVDDPDTVDARGGGGE